MINTIREVAVELLRLKKVKDQLDADDFLRDGHHALTYAGYVTDMPKAWAALESALATAPKVSEQADPAPSVTVIERFTADVGFEGTLPYGDTREEPDGELVRYADHARIVAELQSELADYRMAATAEAHEVDKRGAQIKELRNRAEALAGVLRATYNALDEYWSPELRARIKALLKDTK